MTFYFTDMFRCTI